MKQTNANDGELDKEIGKILYRFQAYNEDNPDNIDPIELLSASKATTAIQSLLERRVLRGRIDELSMLYKATMDALKRSEIFSILPDGRTIKTKERLTELEAELFQRGEVGGEKE